jgi:hypothetical protein
MSTDDLRRELDRISGFAPEVHVAHDTWDRARLSVVRDRVAVAAAGFAVVAIVAAGVTWLPDRLDPPVADSSALGVPDHLYFVPHRMSDRDSDDGSWLRDEVETDVTGIKVGAAAWLTYTGLPVVVDASDGDYHLLDLPDFAGNNETFARGLGNPVVALAPDGRRLAYGYAVFGPDAGTKPIPSGVRVVDLTTGELREIPVPGEEGTAVSRIEWSPDGSWLAFAGMQQGTWTRDSMGNASGDRGGPVLGRIAPGATEAQVRPVVNDGIGLTVDDQGTVTWFSGRLRVWDDDGVAGGSDEDPALERALGTTPDGAAVRLDEDADGATRGVELVSADGTATRVVVIENGVDTSSLSLATDLMSADRPTVDRPEPDWPWSEGRWWVTIVLGVPGAIALLMGLRWLWRRYAPRSSARKAS